MTETHDLTKYGKLSPPEAVEKLRQLHERGDVEADFGDIVVHLPDGKSSRSFVLGGKGHPLPPDDPLIFDEEPSVPDREPQREINKRHMFEAVLTALSKMNTAKLRAFAKEHGNEVKFSRGISIVEKRQIVFDAWHATKTE